MNDLDIQVETSETEAVSSAPESDFQKLTSVEGYLVVERNGKRPRVHLMRPYESCNTDDAPDKYKVAGSREALVSRFGRTIPCLRCFPGPVQEQRALQAEPAEEEVDLDALADELELDELLTPEGYSDVKVGTEEAEG